MKITVKILIFYIGLYLLSSGSLSQCIKLFKNQVVEMSAMDYCEDTAADEEDKSEDGKKEQKLFSDFSLNALLSVYISAQTYFQSHKDDKLSTFYSEIVPPPPKA